MERRQERNYEKRGNQTAMKYMRKIKPHSDDFIMSCPKAHTRKMTETLLRKCWTRQRCRKTMHQNKMPCDGS